LSRPRLTPMNTNPAGGRQIAWDSPRTEQLMADACMDPTVVVDQGVGADEDIRRV
jgi:hypothetical protein